MNIDIIAHKWCNCLLTISKFYSIIFKKYIDYNFDDLGVTSHALVIPITPQAKRAPALPVVLLSSWPPLPRSSGSACTYKIYKF